MTTRQTQETRNKDFYDRVRKAVRPCVTVDLLDHQVDGILWMREQEESSLQGGILADDMGLGKTLQSLVTCLLNGYRTTLIVCPLSLVQNWQSEISDKLSVSMRVGQYMGPTRHALDMNAFDFVITTYGTLERDFALLGNDSVKPVPLFETTFKRVILDESQFIKNHTSKTSIAASYLQAERRWCLSGTPVQNNMEELFSFTRFLNVPGWNSLVEFQEQVAMSPVSDFIKEISLRRTKAILPLPKKKILHVPVSFTDEERPHYEKIRNTMLFLLREFLRQGNRPRANAAEDPMQQEAQDQPARRMSFGVVLKRFMLMRRSCDHIGYATEGFPRTALSSKQKFIVERIQEIVGTTRDGPSGSSIKRPSKIIIFSQFLDMIADLKRALSDKGIRAVTYTGAQRVKDRHTMLEAFKKNPQVRVCIMSTKCASVGLNITQANWVFIAEPWWNPFVDDQAMDRAHRFGQQRTVRVLKLYVPDSIEERILDLQREKRSMVRDLWDEDDDLSDAKDTGKRPKGAMLADLVRIMNV